jgi:hypothetical protein
MDRGREQNPRKRMRLLANKNTRIHNVYRGRILGMKLIVGRMHVPHGPRLET